MPAIDYFSEDFPGTCPVRNGSNTLHFGWNDLLWAAITVGRPSRYFVFRHGVSSVYEALFRLSAIRMTLEQLGPSARRLRRTPAAKTLDPSEKGAINYFLGLTMCKLFAEMLLDAPWLLHLDVFRARLNPGILSGRSRPDLVGRTRGGEWVAMESKGRVSSPTTDCKDKAKAQAERLYCVNGQLVSYRIGGIAYFRDDVLQFFWRDPQPDGLEPRNPIRLDVNEDEIWRAYYAPILNLITEQPSEDLRGEYAIIPIVEADLEIRIIQPVMKLLRLEQWAEIGHWCKENKNQLSQGDVHGDGIQVLAGESWNKRYEDRFE